MTLKNVPLTNKVKNKIIIRSKKSNWYFIGKTFIKLVDAIVPLITLGFYWTDLEYRFVKWAMFGRKKKIKK